MLHEKKLIRLICEVTAVPTAKMDNLANQIVDRALFANVSEEIMQDSRDAFKKASAVFAKISTVTANAIPVRTQDVAALSIELKHIVASFEESKALGQGMGMAKVMTAIAAFMRNVAQPFEQSIALSTVQIDLTSMSDSDDNTTENKGGKRKRADDNDTDDSMSCD